MAQLQRLPINLGLPRPLHRPPNVSDAPRQVPQGLPVLLPSLQLLRRQRRVGDLRPVALAEQRVALRAQRVPQAGFLFIALRRVHDERERRRRPAVAGVLRPHGARDLRVSFVGHLHVRRHLAPSPRAAEVRLVRRRRLVDMLHAVVALSVRRVRDDRHAHHSLPV